MSLEACIGIAATVALAVSAGFVGWLFRIDRLVTLVVANQANSEKDFVGLEQSQVAEFSKLWSAHVDDVKELSAVRERLAVFETMYSTQEKPRAGK